MTTYHHYLSKIIKLFALECLGKKYQTDLKINSAVVCYFVQNCIMYHTCQHFHDSTS